MVLWERLAIFFFKSKINLTSFWLVFSSLVLSNFIGSTSSRLIFFLRCVCLPFALNNCCWFILCYWFLLCVSFTFPLDFLYFLSFSSAFWYVLSPLLMFSVLFCFCGWDGVTLIHCFIAFFVIFLCVSVLGVTGRCEWRWDWTKAPVQCICVRKSVGSRSWVLCNPTTQKDDQFLVYTVLAGYGLVIGPIMWT